MFRRPVESKYRERQIIKAKTSVLTADPESATEQWVSLRADREHPTVSPGSQVHAMQVRRPPMPLNSSTQARDDTIAPRCAQEKPNQKHKKTKATAPNLTTAALTPQDIDLQHSP